MSRGPVEYCARKRNRNIMGRGGNVVLLAFYIFLLALVIRVSNIY
jgi:hypothetical protein